MEIKFLYTLVLMLVALSLQLLSEDMEKFEAVHGQITDLIVHDDDDGWDNIPTTFTLEPSILTEVENTTTDVGKEGP